MPRLYLKVDIHSNLQIDELVEMIHVNFLNAFDEPVPETWVEDWETNVFTELDGKLSNTITGNKYEDNIQNRSVQADLEAI